MTILVALTPGGRDSAALHLGTMMARSAGERAIVAAVVPTTWPRGLAPNEGEYAELADRAATQALNRARNQLDAGIATDFVVHHARSVAAGLLELTTEKQVNLVVLGSSDEGVLGRVGLGGVAHRILHSTEVPVVLAPRGYTGSGERVTRVTAAFGPRDEQSDLLAGARSVAQSLGVGLRVANFAVRNPLAQAGTVEDDAEDLVVRAWSRQVEQSVAASLPDSAGGDGTHPTEIVVGQGDTWGEAIAAVPWTAGDLLAVGARSSAISRFLLGSHAAKIVRNSPVPVYLVPRLVHD